MFNKSILANKFIWNLDFIIIFLDASKKKKIEDFRIFECINWIKSDIVSLKFSQNQILEFYDNKYIWPVKKSTGSYQFTKSTKNKILIDWVNLNEMMIEKFLKIFWRIYRKVPANNAVIRNMLAGLFCAREEWSNFMSMLSQNWYIFWIIEKFIIHVI